MLSAGPIEEPRRSLLSEAYNDVLSLVIQKNHLEFTWLLFAQQEWPQGIKVTFLQEERPTASVRTWSKTDPEIASLLRNSTTILGVAPIATLEPPLVASFQDVMERYAINNGHGKEGPDVAFDALWALNEAGVITIEVERGQNQKGVKDAQQAKLRKWLNDFGEQVDDFLDGSNSERASYTAILDDSDPTGVLFLERLAVGSVPGIP